MLLVAAVCEVGRHYYFLTIGVLENSCQRCPARMRKAWKLPVPVTPKFTKAYMLGWLIPPLQDWVFPPGELLVHAEGSLHRGRAWGIWKQYCGWPPYRSLNRHGQALSLPIPLFHASPETSNEYSLFTQTPWEIFQYAKLLFSAVWGGNQIRALKQGDMTLILALIWRLLLCLLYHF